MDPDFEPRTTPLSPDEKIRLRSLMQEQIEDAVAQFGLLCQTTVKEDDNHVSVYTTVNFPLSNEAPRDFAAKAAAVGIPEDCYGKTVVHKTKVLKIVDVNLRAQKYPVEMLDTISGKRWRYPAHLVVTLLTQQEAK